MLRSFILLALSGAAAAASSQTTATSSSPSLKKEEAWIPMLTEPKEGIQASLLGVKKGATTAVIECGKDVDHEDCSELKGVTVTYGPTTAAYVISRRNETVEEIADVDCTGNNGDRKGMVCDVTISRIDGDHEQATENLVPYSADYMTDAVTLTITGNPGDPKTTGEPGSTPLKPTASATPTDNASATSTSSDNVAGPARTQNAFLVGAAAVAGGAAMLL